MLLDEFFLKTILPIISGFGAVSFIWNVYDYRQQQTGFLKLGLQCNYALNGTEKYITSKTLLENTNKRPVKVVHAFLLIVDRQMSYEEARDLVIEYVSKKIPSRRKKGINDESVKDGSHNHNEFRRFFRRIFRNTIEYISNNGGELEEEDFIIKLLPYYYSTHIRLGSFAHMATTHIQEMRHKGIYSVYFAVFGKRWYDKKDPSEGRVVHDEVIV